MSVMNQLVVEPSETSQWYRLVLDAEELTQQQLSEDLENYLVLTLSRFSQRPEMVNTIFALSYLNGVGASGKERYIRLRDIGDQCLLFAGFFPEQAEKRLVSFGYFVELGRAAYYEIANAQREESAELFGQLVLNYVDVLRVLHAIRGMDAEKEMSPLLAMEIWQRTKNQDMLSIVNKTTGATPWASESYLQVKH